MKRLFPQLARREYVLSLATAMLVVFVCLSNATVVAQKDVHAPRRLAAGSLPQPRFSDPERARKLAAAFPEIERLFISWVERQHMPGAVLGIVIDGDVSLLAWNSSLAEWRRIIAN